MRKTASARAEVVSQALLAEAVVCIEEVESWSLIKTPDDYVGWVQSEALSARPYLPLMVTCRSIVPLYLQKSILSGPLLTLPFGIGLNAIEDTDPDWFSVQLPQGETYFIRKGNLTRPRTLTKTDLIPFSLQFLGLPYIWGGRSSFGYDCSGFVQMLYQQMGLSLPRDSGAQSEDPRFRDIERKDLQIGDLIFWGNSRKEIRHVGLYIGGDQFIHASSREHKPWVRISSLSDSAWNCGVTSVYPDQVLRKLR